MDEKKSVGPILNLTPGATFTANGRLYTVYDSVTIGRFDRLEELEAEAMQGADNKTCHDVMRQAIELFNKSNQVAGYALLYNKVDSDQRNSTFSNYILRVCACYINYEGEDLAYLKDETIIQKKNDWSAEGFDMAPFIAFAVSVCNGLLHRYRKHLEIILSEALTINEALTRTLDIRISPTSSEPPITSTPTNGTRERNFG